MERDDEFGAASKLTVHFDGTVHLFDQAAADRQAEAGSVSMVLQSPVFLGLLEHLKNTCLVFRCNSTAGVDYTEGQRAVLRCFALEANFDGNRALFGELHRIADQIEEDLAEPQFVETEQWQTLGQVRR